MVEARLYAGEQQIGTTRTKSLSADEYLPCEDVRIRLLADGVPSRMEVLDQRFKVENAKRYNKGDLFALEWHLDTNVVSVIDTIRMSDDAPRQEP